MVTGRVPLPRPGGKLPEPVVCPGQFVFAAASLAGGQRFGERDAYPGRIFFVKAGQSGGLRAARARFNRQVRGLVKELDIDTDRKRVKSDVSRIAAWMSGQKGPSLRIVDDLPPQTDAATIGKFTVSSGQVRTLFTARIAPGGVREIPLTGLDTPDALAVLRSSRAIDGPAERFAAETIVGILGGHPRALSDVAVEQLLDTEGLQSYQDYAQRLTARGPDISIISQISDFMGTLNREDRVVIMLARFLGSDPLPAPLVSAVLAAADSSQRRASQLAISALKRLQHRGLAVHQAQGWRIHPLAIAADMRRGAPPYSEAWLADAVSRLAAESSPADGRNARAPEPAH